VLHASELGAHWLHRFASALQPAKPQSREIVPSPVELHRRALFASQAMNSSAVHDDTNPMSGGASRAASRPASASGEGTSAGRGNPHAIAQQINE
jgi:hypothetical protein